MHHGRNAGRLVFMSPLRDPSERVMARQIDALSARSSAVVNAP